MPGLPAQPVDLNASWAFFWTVFVSIWAHTGFYTLVLLAGLQAIPRDIFDAASMDAAPPGRVSWRITLPPMPSVLVVLVLALIRAARFSMRFGPDGRGSRDGDNLSSLATLRRKNGRWLSSPQQKRGLSNSAGRDPCALYPSFPRQREVRHFSRLPPCSCQGQALGPRLRGDDEFVSPLDFPTPSLVGARALCAGK